MQMVMHNMRFFICFMCLNPSLPLYTSKRSPFGPRFLLKMRVFHEFIDTADF